MNKDNTIIKHVYGNILRVAIPLTVRTRTLQEGVEVETEEDFYPNPNYPTIIDLYKGFGQHYTFDATVEGNVASFTDQGDTPIGIYQVEVTCKDSNGNHVRYMVRAIIEIVDATIDAGIKAGVEFNAESYTLEGAVFFYAKGESLYQLMVEEGRFVGTLEEFLDQYENTLKAASNAAKTTLETNARVQDAEELRVTAESERKSAETIRNDKESEREASETTRNNSERTRVEKENQREASETTRKNNEDARITTERMRATAEGNRNANETTRQKNEETRESHERTRVQNETERQRDEDLRTNAERTRVTAESSRVQAEEARAIQSAADHAQAENDHSASVNATEGAEQVNASLEGSTVTITDRHGNATSVDIGFSIYRTYSSVAEMNADAANVEEGKFVLIATTSPTSSENARLYVRNGNSATSSEPFRFLSDLDQASSEAWADWLENMKPAIESRIATADNDHSQSVSDHGIATDDHTQASQDHTVAIGDHTQAENDHSTASQDHATASSDHEQALQDHTQANTDHATAVADHEVALADHEEMTQNYVSATQAQNFSDTQKAQARQNIGAMPTMTVDDVPTADSSNLVKSGGVQNELALGAVYDVSAKNPTAGPNNDGKWESLSALLSDTNLNTLIPTVVRKGGMSVKFVQSSDNKYVQYRYVSSSTATANFTNVDNWQGVADNIVYNSNDVVTSKAVAALFESVKPVTRASGYDFSGDVLELFVMDSPYQTLKLQSSNSNQALLFQNNASDAIVARTDVGVIEANNVVYPIKITKTNDETNYPIGKVIALIVFSDYSHFLSIGSSSAIVPVRMGICFSSHYAPTCIDYLLKNKISNEVDTLDVEKADKSDVTALSETVENLGNNVNDILDSYINEEIWTENAVKDHVTTQTILSGRGNAIASNKTIYKVTVEISNVDYTQAKVTKLKLVLREANKNGKVLAQKIADIDYDDNNLHDVTFDFTDNPVQYDGVIFATIQGDNNFNSYCINKTDYGFSVSSVYTTETDLTIKQPFINSSNNNNCIWVTYVSELRKILITETENIEDRAVTEEKLSEEVQEKLNTPNPPNPYDGIKVVLPSDIVVTVGSNLQLFHRGIVSAVNPYNYNIEVSVYNKSTSITEGKAYNRYYQLTAISAKIGNYGITIDVKDNKNNIISTATGTIRVIATPSSPAAQKNILIFGASVVSEGYIADELRRRLTLTSGTLNNPTNPKGLGLSNIGFIGRKTGSAVTDIHQEATGGWGWYNYVGNLPRRYRFYITDGSGSNIAINETFTLNGATFTVKEKNITNGSGNISCTFTGTVSGEIAQSGVLPLQSGNVNYSSYLYESSNPFLNPNTGEVDFENYSTTYCNGANIDILISHLGVNDMAGDTANISNIISMVKMIARAYHTYCTDNNIDGKFIVSTISVPDTHGAFGTNYNADGAKSNYYTILRRFFEFSEAVETMANDDEFSSYVVHAPVMQESDGENMYPSSEVNVNNRNTEKEKIGQNAYHPLELGHKIIADAIYQSVCDVLQ